MAFITEWSPPGGLRFPSMWLQVALKADFSHVWYIKPRVRVRNICPRHQTEFHSGSLAKILSSQSLGLTFVSFAFSLSLEIFRTEFHARCHSRAPFFDNGQQPLHRFI